MHLRRFRTTFSLLLPFLAPTPVSSIAGPSTAESSTPLIHKISKFPRAAKKFQPKKDPSELGGAKGRCLCGAQIGAARGGCAPIGAQLVHLWCAHIPAGGERCTGYVPCFHPRAHRWGHLINANQSQKGGLYPETLLMRCHQY